MICGVRLTQRSSQKVRTRPLTDREGRGVCRSFKSTAVVPVAFGTLWCCGGPPAGGGGDVGLGSGQATRGNPFKLGGRAHRSRQRAAVVGRRRVERAGGPPPRLGPMVQRYNPHRSLRRGPDERRRFCRPRWRDQLRHGAGAGGSRAARRRDRHRRSHRQCDPQDRSPAAARRGQRRAPGHPGVHHDPWKRQPRDRARAPVHSCRGQSVAFGVRALRQHSRLQCAEGPRQIRGTSGECRRRRRRRAGRGGVVLHARPQHGLAAGKDCGSGLPRRGAHPRARCRQLGRQFGAENGGDPHHFDAGDADGLCARAPRRSLCRFRAAHRARKRHPAAQDHRPGDRRQCLQRTHHRAQEGRYLFRRSCARWARRRKR